MLLWGCAEKLPGVQVDKDGSIKAQGENVQRILVDGKRFFGDDPKLATKNLPPDMIDKIPGVRCPERPKRLYRI